MTLKISQLILRIKSYTHKIMIEYQQFLNWLKTKNLLDLYIDEFNKFQQKLNSGSTIPNRKDWMRLIYGKTVKEAFTKHSRDIINCSFDWGQTGKYIFWAKVNEKFQDLWNTNNL